MPAFYPPLAKTSYVHVPANNTDRYVHLHFMCTFDQEEDTSGSWEMWTDLPSLDRSGQLQLAEGEWRVVSFAPFQGPIINDHAQVNKDDDDPPVIHLSSSQSPSAIDQAPNIILYAIVTTYAIVGQTYAYTFRRVLTSGEVQWLGGDDSNGVIRMEETSTVPSATTIDESNMTWEGVGIEFEQADGWV